jgi:hypothetical protein
MNRAPAKPVAGIADVSRETSRGPDAARGESCGKWP